MSTNWFWPDLLGKQKNLQNVLLFLQVKFLFRVPIGIKSTLSFWNSIPLPLIGNRGEIGALCKPSVLQFRFRFFFYLTEELENQQIMFLHPAPSQPGDDDIVPVCFSEARFVLRPLRFMTVGPCLHFS